MATPERRTTATPAVPDPAAAAPAGPVPVLAPLGWFLCMAAGAGLLLASWTLYPPDYDGMWAGYRDGLVGLIVLMVVMGLNTTLPRTPQLGLLGLCGALLVLFAVFIDQGQIVFVTELVAGVVLLVGTALQAAAPRR